MLKKYKLVNEYISVAHILSNQEPYNSNIDIVDIAVQTFFKNKFQDSADLRNDIDYVLSVLVTKPKTESVNFDRIWEQYVDTNRLHKLTYVDFKPLFHDFGDLQISTNPKQVVSLYKKIYRHLIKYIKRTYACPVEKTDIGLTYELDIDITHELDEFVTFNAFREFGQRKRYYHQLRNKHATKYDQREDLRHLKLTQADIEFELVYRKLEPQIIDTLTQWHNTTKINKDDLRAQSKRTRKIIIQLFTAMLNQHYVRQDYLWGKIVDLIDRRSLYPSYELFKVFIGILDRFKDKRLVNKHRKNLENQSMCNITGIPTLDDIVNKYKNKQQEPRHDRRYY